MSSHYPLAILDRYWVLSNRESRLQFLHKEDLVWTNNLHDAMTFKTINDAQRHRKEMIEQFKNEECLEEELSIYFKTIPREIRLSIHE